MKKTLALLAASTALTAAIGIPAWSAMHSPKSEDGALAALIGDDHGPMRVWLASDDDDDDRRKSRKHHDDDEDDDDDDDDRGGRGGQMNPAPAGTVAPPSNGLFGTGTPPKVQVN